MSVIDYDLMHKFGTVQSVDTANVTVHVKNAELLSKLQVNHLVAIRAPRVGQTLIGIVNKIVRKVSQDNPEEEADGENISSDIVKVTLIGTLLERDGEKRDVFKRALDSVPGIDADCFIMSDQVLTNFMGAISRAESEGQNPLCIGTYAIDDRAEALLDGNKLFQRHTVIVGSTGSGKSCTVAALIEKIAKLPSCSAMLFDMHGEYEPIVGSHIHHYKIAGPTDSPSDSNIFLPYWLLTYEEMLSLMLDRSDNNAPNQAMVFSETVINLKQAMLNESGHDDISESITLDSPVPYSITTALEKLKAKDEEMVRGVSGKEKQGSFNGKLTRFIQRLRAKKSDKRLNFMFSEESDVLNFDYLESICKRLMAPASRGGGVKIIDFSEVPSDILPLIVSLLARIVFSVQQWMDKLKINPLSIFCDEAHLYIPANAAQGVEASSLQSFERIAKEGRKYGLGLVIISQRPSEVNRTVLSQSNNFIAMRLTNAEDQMVIRKLLPDSMGNFADLLPILDVGEAIVVGDASLLPSRILINEPEQKPNSATVQFWDKWNQNELPDGIAAAVKAMRLQSRQQEKDFSKHN